METSNYTNMRAATNLYVSKMNGISTTFNSRADFVSWINTSGNLLLTLFTSTTQAISIADAMVSAQTTLMSANSSFYTLLQSADPDQIAVIFHPIQATPPSVTIFNACQQGCMDDASYDLDVSWAQYTVAFAAAIHLAPWSISMAESAYYIREGQIGLAFNDCYSLC